MNRSLRMVGSTALAVALLTTSVGSLSIGLAGSEPSARRCTPGYSPCIRLKRSDVDCYGGGGNGPRYTKPGVVYRVARGKDRYGLDSDRDGRGCERN